MYHSTALRTRVLVAGSDLQVNIADNGTLRGRKLVAYMARTFEYRLEVFTPPYLRKEGVLRPVIDPTENHRSIEYGTELGIKVANLDQMPLKSLRVTLLEEKTRNGIYAR